MQPPLLLASGSKIRRRLLEQAGVPVEVSVARIDEDSVRASMLAEQAAPRDIADLLAEMKARKVSDKHPGRLVLGCDQVLDHRGSLLAKATTRLEAEQQLRALCGDRHNLLSAAVLYQNGRPIWRHVGMVRLQMRTFSDAYLAAYLDRNWPGIQDSVGSYKLEEEGIRLFSKVDGDYFNVLGLPLLELLAYLTERGDLPG
ncbi:nucleoside triphosphate pyrophosphatase [Pseudoruegeria sp. SK021]|uniref:Maf family protein n=1 Tax=Pseudoruegeria sp. SK021 TaxID=1933035 RepID=UPI000A246F09|nr:nucleoside triphosphate pyrophosphatase [Pseudoruegeria sp. SK021]OSP55343.1 septum formation protein Maf [Pseudoruegeria sp. SK021]